MSVCTASTNAHPPMQTELSLSVFTKAVLLAVNPDVLRVLIKQWAYCHTVAAINSERCKEGENDLFRWHWWCPFLVYTRLPRSTPPHPPPKSLNPPFSPATPLCSAVAVLFHTCNNRWFSLMLFLTQSFILTPQRNVLLLRTARLGCVCWKRLSCHVQLHSALLSFYL